MKRLTTVFALLVGLSATAFAAGPATSKKAAAIAPRVVTLTGTDDMKFAPATIRARPGERLRVVLRTMSAMPKVAMAHNFVILNAGASEAAFVNASAMARESQFLAPQLRSQVLVSTTLAGGGETVSAEFAAPRRPGRYTFICTFPGHFNAGMMGVLIVN